MYAPPIKNQNLVTWSRHNPRGYFSGKHLLNLLYKYTIKGETNISIIKRTFTLNITLAETNFFTFAEHEFQVLYLIAFGLVF